MNPSETKGDKLVLQEENRRLQSTVEELSILNEVATAISSAQTVDKIEYQIVKKCIKHLSVEEGAVMLFNEDDLYKPFQTMFRTKNSLLDSLPHTLDAQITNWVLKNKTTLVINNFAQDERFVKSGEVQNILKSLLCAPMFIKGKLLGIIVLFNKTNGEFTDRDQRLLSILATQSAQVIESARLYQQESAFLKLKEEMNLASQIQNNLLPRTSLKLGGYTITGKTIPAKDVGGDFFDYVTLADNKIAIWLGDVSGKGMPAALMMANIHGFLRSRCAVDKDCIKSVTAANEMIFKNSGVDKFATLFYSILDTGTSQLNFVIAGHNNIIHLNGNKEVTVNKSYGIPVGLYQSYNFEEKVITPDSGDLILIYSDGIIEAENDKEEFFGEERLIEILKQPGEIDLQKLTEEIYSELKSFSRNTLQADDQTLLLIKRE